MASRMKAIALRKEQEKMDLTIQQAAMRYGEQMRRDAATAVQQRRAEDLRSQAQTRMEGTMIAPEDRPTALDRVKGVGEYGAVRKFPSPATQIPVGGGFVLKEPMGGMSGIKLFSKKK